MSPKNSDIVLTSRVRLARNINGLAFPEWASLDDQAQAKLIAKKAISDIPYSFTYKELRKTSELNKKILVEKNILSSRFVEGDSFAKAYALNNENSSILINEEDHLRLAVQLSGLRLEECWRQVDKFDSALSDEIEFAFSSELGFATACPSNIGTGMRVSVMMHLPALCLNGEVSSLVANLSESRITVRGLFGEGSLALGHLFQISNLVSLGFSEIETLNYLKRVANTIIKKEILARQNILKGEKIRIKDKVRRSIGILRYACILSYEEALQHLSTIILGQSLNLEKQIKPLKDLRYLSMQIRDGHLLKEKSNRSKKAPQVLRAEKVKELVS